MSAVAATTPFGVETMPPVCGTVALDLEPSSPPFWRAADHVVVTLDGFLQPTGVVNTLDIHVGISEFGGRSASTATLSGLDLADGAPVHVSATVTTGAGLTCRSAAPSVLVDTSPPAMVRAGVSPRYATDGTVFVNWTASWDDDSGVAYYEVAAGAAPGDTDEAHGG